MNEVTKFVQRYHAMKVSRPNLYKISETVISVGLPKSLLDYANAAAGHSGLGNGARAVGIRREVDNADEALAEIFSSAEAYVEFIKTSECDAHHITGLGQKRRGRKDKATSAATDERMADANFAEINANYNVSELVAKFGREVVLQARKVLTMNEFALRFGL